MLDVGLVCCYMEYIIIIWNLDGLEIKFKGLDDYDFFYGLFGDGFINWYKDYI